jgi:alginate O-acetyltransferase complex protein AlgI
MIFNSFEYLIFLPISFLLYWFVFGKSLKLQNLLLLVLSYVFYAWWDWRFLSLIIFSSFVDYHSGLFINKAKKIRDRRFWLTLSMVTNLGFLGIFKYFNFFADSLRDFFLQFDYHLGDLTLDVILPVGISFYTFQTMSYTIDVYRGKIKPTKSIIDFFVFVSFFPQLVAGPIERATNLLPQFQKRRFFKYEQAVDGMRQILWGLFKKIVVADNAAIVVNVVFANPGDLNASTLMVGVVFFAFQIYGDFSGYSDIAIGTAKLFGFKLMQNFSYPYFSRDIAEFWRRWHISLSTWFRDYLYIPLGGSRGGDWLKVKNIFIIFIVSGFWHGANWTFIIWGALNALYILPLVLFNKNRINLEIVAFNSYLPNLKEIISILFTFTITCIAWVFFRADSLSSALSYLIGLFSLNDFGLPTVDLKPFGYIFVLIAVEWIQRRKVHGLDLNNVPMVYRWVFYFLLVMSIILFGAKSDSFIYFQF